MTIHGTTISRRLGELLDPPDLLITWDVTAQVNADGEIDRMPLLVVMDNLPGEIDRYAIGLIKHIWCQIHKFEEQTRQGKNEAIYNLKPLMRVEE